MGLEQKLNLRLSQRLVMTPSLQQAINLLQMSKLELEEVLNQEMVENPVLEEEQEEAPPAEPAPATAPPAPPAGVASRTGREAGCYAAASGRQGECHRAALTRMSHNHGAPRSFQRRPGS